jgi:hypothetical protein
MGFGYFVSGHAAMMGHAPRGRLRYIKRASIDMARNDPRQAATASTSTTRRHPMKSGAEWVIRNPSVAMTVSLGVNSPHSRLRGPARG